MAYLDREVAAFGEKIGLQDEFRRRSMMSGVSFRMLEHYGIEAPEELRSRMDEARRLRNFAAHGRKEPKMAEVIDAIKTVEEFEKFLSSLNLEELAPKAEAASNARRQRAEANMRALRSSPEVEG